MTDNSSVNNLSQWFENVFHNGWQPIETLLNLDEIAFVISFRNNSEFNKVGAMGAKIIDLGILIENKNVVLLVAFTPEDSEEVTIRARLHPTNENVYLPSNVKLILLSQSGEILQQVESRTRDHYIELRRFKSTYGNSFIIEVALNDASIKEKFLLEEPVS